MAESNLPWVEKYRPESLDQIISHTDIISTINRFLERGQLPHLLFHGPPGTGKTSTIKAIAKQLYHKNYRHMVLELNASDDRGITVVRDVIKAFAETQCSTSASAPSNAAVLSGSGVTERDNQTENPLSRIKLVILDEGDQMTGAAQMALRRIVEKYAETVRFCVVCNYVNKVNPALQSRCTKFRFSPLPEIDIQARVQQIADTEGVVISSGGIHALVTIARGDMRRVLNTLQSAAMSNEGKPIDESVILNTAGLPSPKDIDVITDHLTSGTVSTAFEEISSMIKVGGYALEDVVSGVYSKSLGFSLPTSAAVTIYPRLAEIEYRLARGAEESIQLAALIATFVETRDEIHTKLHKRRMEASCSA